VIFPEVHIDPAICLQRRRDLITVTRTSLRMAGFARKFQPDAAEV
jgi:hypothetical protein